MKELSLSQFLVSVNSFLIQLSIFKVADEKFITSLTVLISLQIFYFMLMRKLSFEKYLIFDEQIRRPPIIEVWVLITTITFVLGLYNKWDLNILVLVTIFGFLNTVLDYKLFSDLANGRIKNLLGNLLMLFILILNLALSGSIIITFACLNLSIGLFLILSCRKELFKALQVRARRTMDIHRGLDFVLGAGLGYLLPILVFYQLGNQGVIEIRASQLFVSLINFFAMSLFLHNLSKQVETNVYVYSLVPSAILFVLYSTLKMFDTFKVPLVAPIFVHLSNIVYFFIASFIFTQISNYLLTKIVRFGFQEKVFTWHLKSMPVFLSIYFGGMALYGSLGFALASIIVHAIDSFALRRILIDSQR